MSIRQPRISTPPARFLALLAAAAFLLTACTAPPGSPPEPSPIAFQTPTAADTLGVETLCRQAAALTAEGYPQRAVAIIDQYNGTLVSDAEQACLPERASALARAAAAERLAQAALSRAKTLSSVVVPPPNTAACVLTTDDSSLLSGAFTCDRENATTLALNATLKDAETATAPTTWADFTAKNVAPWQDLVVAFLLWLVVSAALAQLLPLLTRNFLAHAPPPVGAVGMLVVAAGAAVGTFGAVMHTTWTAWAEQNATWALWAFAGIDAGVKANGSGWCMVAGGLISAVGLLLWDWRRRSTKKLLVTVDGEDTAKAVDNLRGIIADMGSANPRGVLMPVGPDATFLKDVDFTTFGVGGWANAVKSFVLAIKPHVPWNLAVSVVSDDRLAVTLRRNHAPIASEVIDRTWLKLDAGSLADLEKDAPASEKLPAGEEPEKAQLWPFPAALALCSMAEVSWHAPGLGGATNWRGMALQHLATSQLRRRRTVSRVLLGRALDLDPHNHAASLAYWRAIYRDASSEEQLTRYRDLLKELVKKIEERREPAILLRALYSLTATQINLSDPDAGDSQRRLADLVDRLTPSGVGRSWRAFTAELGFDRTHGARELALTMKPLVEDLAKMADPAQLEDEGAGGPSRHYSQACVTRNEPLRAVPLLQLADVEPDLAAWRALDPQLESLHEDPAYREAFGKEVPTDLLGIEPFASYQNVLKPAGLTTATQFVDLGRPALQRQLDVPYWIAERMVRLAGFAVTLDERGLGEWAVPLTDLLGKKNIESLKPRPPLLREAQAAVKDFKKIPTDEQLGAVFAKGGAPVQDS